MLVTRAKYRKDGSEVITAVSAKKHGRVHCIAMKLGESLQISEEHISSFFRVEGYAKQKTIRKQAAGSFFTYPQTITRASRI
jgi:hypothetical protein